MERIDLFATVHQSFNINKTIKQQYLSSSKTISLNPWGQQQSINPFLFVQQSSQLSKNSQGSNKNKKKQKKVISIQLRKKQPQNLLSSLSTKSNELLRKSKQLPKLNIGQLTKNESKLKKRRLRKSPTQAGILTASSSKYASPQRRSFHENNKNENNKNNQMLPSVSRQLNITRKIFLLQNKFSPTQSPSQKVNKNQCPTNDIIRRIVQKQWNKKRLIQIQ